MRGKSTGDQFHLLFTQSPNKLDKSVHHSAMCCELGWKAKSLGHEAYFVFLFQSFLPSHTQKPENLHEFKLCACLTLHGYLTMADSRGFNGAEIPVPPRMVQGHGTPNALCTQTSSSQCNALDSLSTKRKLQRKLKPNVTQISQPMTDGGVANSTH